MAKPHEVLNVPANASKQHIRSAYKSLAMKLHPDRPGGSVEKMTELNNAYQKMLSLAGGPFDDLFNELRAKL